MDSTGHYRKTEGFGGREWRAANESGWRRQTDAAVAASSIGGLLRGDDASAKLVGI